MKQSFICAAICTGAATIATMGLSTGAAEAASLSSTQYYSQLGNKSGLSYETWSLIDDGINGERQALSNGQLVQLDTSKLTWQAGVKDVEVFFINEGAGYHNQFYYSTEGRNNLQTIWEDASSEYSILANGGPLSLGERHVLGDFAGDTRLDFFLQNPQGDLFGAIAEDNIDQLIHLTTYQAGDLLVLAYEDITGGGDRDYNDVVIAVRGLVDTSTADVPEPASTASLVGFGVVGTLLARRKRQANQDV